MKSNKRIWRVLLGTAIALGGVVVPSSAQAVTVQSGKNCVWNVVGTDADGNFIIGSTQCYNTYSDVLNSRGVKSSPTASPSTTTSSTLSTAGIIATHYDGTGYTGTSVSVSGTDCSGGGLNVPLDWNDRISSTQNGCGTIVHYENTNYGGSTAVTTGFGGSITGYMDNKTSSIKYFA